MSSNQRALHMAKETRQASVRRLAVEMPPYMLRIFGPPIVLMASLAMHVDLCNTFVEKSSSRAMGTFRLDEGLIAKHDQ
jgi:hypothetical protein